jgi:hypothetical protein
MHLPLPVSAVPAVPVTAIPPSHSLSLSSLSPYQYFYGNRTYYDEVVTSVSDLRTYLSQDRYPTGQEVIYYTSFII